MYARKIHVQYLAKDQGQLAQDCPLKWLDSFSMRNFTNDAVFDDTIPVRDGIMEIGKRVPLPELRASMEDWFRRKSYIGKEDELKVAEIA
jgi:hypothetical protein